MKILQLRARAYLQRSVPFSPEDNSILFIEPSGPIFRIDRKEDVWKPADPALSGRNGKTDNRFDDPDGIYRVVYASSQRLGCFLETLARFRPDLQVLAELAVIEGEDDYPPPGYIESGWRERRFIGSGTAHGSFADITGDEWTARLRNRMAGYCLQHGLRDFDVSVILSLNRELTQRISAVVHESEPATAGICYLSRHSSGIENWALFEPLNISDAASSRIGENDPDLLCALQTFNLRMR